MTSVVIVNWNTRDVLVSCLQSLEALPADPPHELIVVDNQSTDGSAAAVASRFPNVHLLQPGKNTGYAEGNNLGFAHARGDWILALNPDTEVPSDLLHQCIGILSSNPEIGVLAARLIGPDGETQASVRGFPTLLGVLGDLCGLGRLFPRSVFGQYRLAGFDYTKAQWAPQPMGTFLMFRREALAAIGDPKAPFDPQFPIFFNEVDLLKRLADHGWKCWYDPSIVIKHHGGMSTRQVKKAMIWESHRSLLRYWDRHLERGRGLLPIVRLIVLCAAWVRARGYGAGFRA